MQKRTTRRVTAAFTAISTAFLAFLAAPVAHAAPAAPNSAVIFGDSLLANPTIPDYITSHINPRDPRVKSTLSGCATDDVARRGFAARTGKPTYSYTCAGASFVTGGQHVSQQINLAIAQGKLGRQTSTVIILARANDTYPRIIGQSQSVSRVVQNIEPAAVRAVNRVRAAAPNAKIKVVGYPTVAAPNGGSCVIGQLPPQVFDSRVPQVERAMEAMGNRVAARTGAQYVSLKAASRGHDLCSRDPWLAPLVASPKPANIPFHLTPNGMNAVVSRMAH
ncbi:GDSL-type esterase/lipase family protein [Corynebacterium auriscanis]|uniref:GDSL-type esterase/lipase family protein n=1 Tax=Corynebacterium auriscanis TaxID=99807 RepID=UPI003CF70742